MNIVEVFLNGSPIAIIGLMCYTMIIQNGKTHNSILNHVDKMSNKLDKVTETDKNNDRFDKVLTMMCEVLPQMQSDSKQMAVILKDVADNLNLFKDKTIQEINELRVEIIRSQQTQTTTERR